MLFNAQSSHWQGLGLVSVAFGWSRCLLFISAVQIAWAKRYSMHFIMYLRDVFVTLSVSWDFPADTNCCMLLLRWCMRENLIFSPCWFFPQHKSKYSGSLVCYKEENDQENKTNIRKVQFERVWGMKKGRESKRRLSSSENKALSWEGWKGLDADAYLWKMISGCFPTAPNASFSFLSLVSL